MSDTKTDFIEKFKDRTKKYFFHAIKLTKAFQKQRHQALSAGNFSGQHFPLAQLQGVCRARLKLNFLPS